MPLETAAFFLRVATGGRAPAGVRPAPPPEAVEIRVALSVFRRKIKTRANTFPPELNDGLEYIVGLYGPSILSETAQFNQALKCKLPSVGFLYILSDNIEEFQRQAADSKEAFKSGMGFALDEALYQTPLNH